MNSSARRSGVPASSLAAARISSSVAEPTSSVSASVNGLASRCTNRWPELVRSTSKSARSATTSGRTAMRLSLRWDALAAAATLQPSSVSYPKRWRHTANNGGPVRAAISRTGRPGPVGHCRLAHLRIRGLRGSLECIACAQDCFTKRWLHMRIPGKWLTAGGLAVALATVMPTMATAAGGRPAAAGGRAAGRAAAARSGAAESALPAGLASLSPQQLAGQRVIYGYSGLTPPARLISLIKHGEAAGVIFFGQNISSEAQIANVIKQLDQANASPLNPVQAPLLLMTDQEGGEVRRLPGRPYLSEKQIGANSQAETLAKEAGQGAASNLRSVGMNVNLAPVLDVYRNAGDFDDQFGRSYSIDRK